MSYKFNPFTANLDKVNDAANNINSGTTQGQLAFWDATLGKWVNTETSEMFWDDTNKRFGVGTATPVSTMNVNGDLFVQSVNGRRWGINGLAPGHTVYFQFGGDGSNQMETTYGSFVRFRSYWGIVMQCFQGEIARFGTSFNSIDSYFNGNVSFSKQTAHSSVDIDGSLAMAISTKTADYTATIDDHTIVVDATSNTVDITLPTAVGIAGRMYNVKCIDATYAVTVDGDGTETIDGELTQTLSQWDCIKLQSDGANWIVI